MVADTIKDVTSTDKLIFKRNASDRATAIYAARNRRREMLFVASDSLFEPTASISLDHWIADTFFIYRANFDR